MLLAAFGMAGVCWKGKGTRAWNHSDSPQAVHSARRDGTSAVWQGAVRLNGNLLTGQQGAERLLLTGWVDLSSCPEMQVLLRSGAGQDALALLRGLQHLLDLRGHEGVRGLRGDFVLAHVPLQGDTVRLYRSVNSLTPLFWSDEREGVAWSADPAQLLGRRPRRSDVDRDVLPMLIAERGMPDDRSWFRGISRLPAGSLLILDSQGNCRVEEFDSLNPHHTPPCTIDEAAEGITERLAQACRRMLAHEDSAVLLLSGGVDSAAVAQEVGRLGLRATGMHFTLDSFPGFDEDRVVAETVSRACGLAWAPYEMSRHARTGGDYLSIPDTGALPQTHVPLQGIGAAVEQAEAAGATFVLSGLLADQVFAHDVQRGLFGVLGPALLDPRVAGEPIWQLVSNAVRSSSVGGAQAPASTAARLTAAVRYLRRLVSADPASALPERNTIIHPVGLTDQAAHQVGQALEDQAKHAARILRRAMPPGRARRRLPRGITSLFMLQQSLNTANLQAAWLNYALPKHRFIATPFTDRDLIEYAMALPDRHRLGFTDGLLADKFALRLAYASQRLPASVGHRMQQARIDSISALHVSRNFDTCRDLLTRESLLCRWGVLSEEFVSGLNPARVHRNGEEIARYCVIESWLKGLDDA